MCRQGYKFSAVAASLSSLAIFLVVAMNAAAPASVPQVSLLEALDAKEPIPYFIADGTGRAGYHSSDRELAQWALGAWQRSVGKTLRFVPGPESSALVRLYWAESNDGQYGEMRPVMVGGRRGSEVFIQPDVESLGPEMAARAREDPLWRDSIVYLTCLHELGHALGLAHTRDFRDIMYFFGYGGDIVQFFGRYREQVHTRNDIATLSGLSEADVSRIRALYPAQ
jgi:hypothetical protein